MAEKSKPTLDQINFGKKRGPNNIEPIEPEKPKVPEYIQPIQERYQPMKHHRQPNKRDNINR